MAEQLTRRDLLRRGGLGAVAAMAVAASPAFAQEPVSYVNENDTPIQHAAKQLEEYSQETGGVGIIIFHSPWENGLSGDQIGDILLGKFKEQNSDASYTVVENDVPGFAVAYVMYDVSSGPYNPDDALKVIPEIVEINNAAQRLHGREQVSQLNLEK